MGDRINVLVKGELLIRSEARRVLKLPKVLERNQRVWFSVPLATLGALSSRSNSHIL